MTTPPINTTQKVQLSTIPLDAAEQPDATATVAWTEDSAGAVVTLSGASGPDGDGAWHVDVVSVAVGTAHVVATATDGDGNQRQALAETITVVSTDVTHLAITSGTPVPQ